MAFRIFLVLTIAVVGTGCDPASDSGAPQAAVPAIDEPPAWEDELYEMADALGLSIAEEDAVRAAYEARDAEVRAFMESERGRQLSEDEAALADATRARDLAAVRAITDRARDDRAELMRIVEDGKRRIRDALPEDKRVEWDAHRIASEMFEVMEPLELTSDQRWEIEAQAVTNVEAAIARNEPNPMAAAYLSLEKWAENAVLTPEQRQAYQSLKKENPLRSLRF